MNKRPGLMLAAVIGLGFLLSYALALASEPQSVWLWCDVMGACPGGDGA